MNDHHEKTHIKTNSNTDSTGFSFNMIDKSIIEDLIKCDICNIIFDSNTHAPLMLKCGHTFCKRCISYKSNNPEKNINKMCPLDKKKNMMSLESAILNLKLESIVKKLTNYNILNSKRHMVYSKPGKKSISPINSNNSTNTMSNYYINNASNNINVNINNIKNNDINNINIINKGKEPNALQNSIKAKINLNINVNKKNQGINKLNNINIINTTKNKIHNLTNANNININNINNEKLNIDDINKLNNIPSNGQLKTISSGIYELNDNLNTPKLEEEMNAEEESFKKGIINETIDTIPVLEEKVGDTSFGGDINELLLKSIAQKKIFLNEETMNEEFNSSLKELNLMGNQDSLNISLTNTKEDNNNLNLFKINKANLLDKPNTHQIRTIYDRIKSKLNNVEEQKDKNNNNIINNISNSIIIINDDNINIITDNSSSQSQEKVLRNNAVIGEQINSQNKDINDNHNLEMKDNGNNENDLVKINQLNLNKNNFFQSEPNIKINQIINKNVNINLIKDLKSNENNINHNDRFSANVKLSKIGIHKHVHSNSDDYNEEKNKQYLKNCADTENKQMTLNTKKTIEKDSKKEIKKPKIIENQNLNISYESGSNSNSFKKKLLYSPSNNLSKSFVNLSGNNFDDDNINEEKLAEIEKMKKNLDNNKFMTINTIKSAKSQIEKIKNNIYYESQNKNIKANKEIKETKENNHQIHPIVTTKKKSSNNNIYHNNLLTEIKSNPKDNNIVININNNIIDTEKDANSNNLTNNQNINKNPNLVINNINTSKNTKVIGEQILKKNSKTNESYKRLKTEFDLLMNERNNLITNKNIANNPNSSNIHTLNSTSQSSTISITNHTINKIRKKQEEAFQNYFKNQKYKTELDKTKIKFFQNDFFIGILDQDEKYPLKGILLSNNGDYYDGEFSNGKREGEGKLIYANGNQYEGTFLGGFPNGRGKLIQTDNDIYEGDWKNGKINGQGIRLHNNGDKYIGNHLNDVRSGKGLYLFVNGDSYNGNWVNGKANGKGILKFRNGDIYDGEFKDNCIYGKGTFKKKNGEIYIGEFNLGLINGFGKYVNTLGEQYVGEFLSGKKHGIGKLYNKEGKLIQFGNWKNDKYCGNIKYSK